MIIHPVSETHRSATAVTETIVTAVGDAENCDVLELPPLWDVIDPEALDALFAPTRSGQPRIGRVTIEYAGYEIRIAVAADATVTVSLEAATEPTTAESSKNDV